MPGYDRCCPYGTKYILRAEALIKLALMGFQPWERREMLTRLTCVVATFNLPPLQGALPWTGVSGVETP